MNKKLALAATILLAITFQQTIQAEEFDNGDQANVDSESTTKTWLELQRSGNQASQNAQTLSGPVMQNVYERYKESFTRPIPQVTEQDARKIK